MRQKLIIISLIIILTLLAIASLNIAEIDVDFHNVMLALFNNASDYNNNLIQNIRLPRTLTGIFLGATLSISGLFTGITFKNSLADSSILGIQSGATVGALTTLIILPSMLKFLPVFAFLGGAITFIILILSSNGFKNQTRTILTGVAINSAAVSIIGIINLMNPNKMRNALTWLNGSIANVSRETMLIISIYSVLILIISALSMPVIKILLLSDNSIVNIGYNPSVLKLIISVIAVMLASVSVAFIGIISFIGIIAPAISKKIIGTQLKYQFICSSLIGGILLILADIVQRIIFSPTEIPVGILIGMIGAPVFIGLSIGGYGVDKN